MKNIKINHEFTLKWLLESIKKSGIDCSSYEDGYKAMQREIYKYLGMIE
jgi:hypothetical protein